MSFLSVLKIKKTNADPEWLLLQPYFFVKILPVQKQSPLCGYVLSVPVVEVCFVYKFCFIS